MPDIPPEALTYFPDSSSGAGHLSDSVKQYNRKNLADSSNVETDSDGKGTVGWNVAGKLIAVTKEGIDKGKNYVWETIRHEVQHDADMHEGSEKAESVKGFKLPAEYRKALISNLGKPLNQMSDAERRVAFVQFKDQILENRRSALEGYKTEYRAYSYEGSANTDNKAHDINNLTENSRGYRWTERQLSIFNQIYSEYEYVEQMWNSDKKYFNGKYFCDKANAYRNPDVEGVNKYNSLRINKLYKALQDLADETDRDVDTGKVINKDAPKAKTVIRAIGYLAKNDLNYLKDSTQSVLLNKMVNENLGGAALRAFTEKLKNSGDDADLDLGGLF